MNKLSRASSSGLPRAASRGFTLIEILVATAILAMVGMAVVVAEKQYMSSATTNKHKLQAIGLAQEGIEAVTAAFDKNLLAGNSKPMKLISDATPDPSETYALDSSGNLCVLGSTACDGKVNLDQVEFTRKITFPKAP